MAGVALVASGRAFGRVFEMGIENMAEVVELDMQASVEQGRVVVAAALAAVLVRLLSPRLRYRQGPLEEELERWRRRVGALV